MKAQSSTKHDYISTIQIDALRKELEEKVDELQSMDTLNQTLILKEHMSNLELQDACKELINVRFFLFFLHMVNVYWKCSTFYVYYQLPFCFANICPLQKKKKQKEVMSLCLPYRVCKIFGMTKTFLESKEWVRLMRNRLKVCA